MSKKLIKINFSEQSKSVLADVSITYEGEDCPRNEDVLTEAKNVFAEAQRFALNQTFARNK